MMAAFSKSVFLKWLSAAAIPAAALAVLYIFPPGAYGFYPRCMFQAISGWQCPGCGSLRAMHHLLHGDIAVAFGFNPLLVLAVPVLAVVGAAELARRTTGRQPPACFHHPAWGWLALGVILAFGVARNLP